MREELFTAEHRMIATQLREEGALLDLASAADRAPPSCAH
jgi:hypothetical protein